MESHGLVEGEEGSILRVWRGGSTRCTRGGTRIRAEGRCNFETASATEDHGSLDDGGKFPDVPRPGVMDEEVQVCGRRRQRHAPEALAGSPGEVLGEGGDVPRAFSKRRKTDGEDTDPVPEVLTESFDLRRLRADLRGTVYRDYDFRVNLDYAGNRVEVLDAYLDACLTSALQLRVGKFKEPVGLERLQGVFALTFAERGLPTALAPNRDIGAQLHGSIGGSLFGYAVGLFNGVADGASGDHDPSDGKDLSGRVFVHPFERGGWAVLKGLGLGVAGTVGSHRGSPEATGLPTLRTTIGRSTFLRYRADGTATGTVVADGRRTRIAPQGYWYWRNFGVLGEYIRTRTEVRLGDVSTDLTHRAWQVAGSWVLTGEPATHHGVVPTRVFDPGRGTWGAWAVALRVQGLEGDVDAFPLLADPMQSVLAVDGFTIGVHGYLNRAVRFLLDYERTRFEAAPGGGHRSAEGVLVSRFQVAF